MKTICSSMELEQTVLQLGFLPFFPCGIDGFSIQERIDPAYWFSDETKGAWEWKGPLIREGHCAYGKFFAKRAGYVNLEWFPHLMNVRRTCHYAKDEDTAALDDVVLQAIEGERSTTVRELRQLLGLSGRRGSRHASDPVDLLPSGSRLSLEPILTRLMMETHVVIADFEYNVDRHGRTYGWGVARYTTPEQLYGPLRADCSPEESYDRIYRHLRTLFPEAPERRIQALIR